MCGELKINYCYNSRFGNVLLSHLEIWWAELGWAVLRVWIVPQDGGP